MKNENLTNDEKALKWDLLMVAHDLTPLSHKGSKDYKKGWFDAGQHLLTQMVFVEDWYDNIDEKIKPKLRKLIFDDKLFYSIGGNPFFYHMDDKPDTNIELSVPCGDFFALYCADAESIKFDEISSLHDMVYNKEIFGHWGCDIWVARKRKACPCEYVLDRMTNRVDGSIIEELKSYK